MLLAESIICQGESKFDFSKKQTKNKKNKKCYMKNLNLKKTNFLNESDIKFYLLKHDQQLVYGGMWPVKYIFWPVVYKF